MDFSSLIRIRQIHGCLIITKNLNSLCPWSLIHLEEFQAHVEFTKLNFLRKHNIIGIKKESRGVPLWHNRLRTLHCDCSHSGCCCGMGSIPGLGNSIRHRWGQKKKVLFQFPHFQEMYPILLSVIFRKFCLAKVSSSGTTSTHFPWSCSLKHFRTN